MPEPRTPSPGTVVPLILDWLQHARRELPWREERQPYQVWVSEIMLQQTQVATVVPYYRRWVTIFPTLEALAAAPLDQVLKVWEGLGYYARARNLHRAAKEIVDRYRGEIPRTRQELVTLPGIGRYTAGAILSLAYGQPEPAVDGNVHRVLSRLYDVDDAGPVAESWRLARELVTAASPGRAGDLNEGLMELGALMCTPARPSCHACPLSALCLAHHRGVEAERPVRRPTSPVPRRTQAAGVIRDHSGAVLLVRRREHGLLGGLWGLPSTFATPGEHPAVALFRALREALEVEVSVGPEVARVEHIYTHFRVTVHVYPCALARGTPVAAGYARLAWVAPGEVPELALAGADRKALHRLGLA